MKYAKSIIILMFLMMVIISCKKDVTPIDQPNGKSIDELVIPEGFNWSTTQKFQITVGIQNAQAINLKSKISVFNGIPDEGGKLILSGAASNSNPFIESLTIPSYLKEVYLVNEGAYGGKEIVLVPVDGSDINYIFTDTKSTPLNSDFKQTGEIGPDCDDCDYQISGNQAVTITGGKTYCVTGNFTGTVNFETWNNGGTLQVCGEATINNLTLGANSHIIVTQNGQLTIGNFSGNQTSSTITVYENATLIINGQFMTQGNYVTNQGQLTVNGNLTIQNLASHNFLNSGTIDVSGQVAVNNNTTLINSGTINATGSYFYLNSGSTVLNSGTINFEGANQFQVNSGSSVTNDGEISVTGTLKINSGSTVVNNCALMCTETMEVNTSNFTNNSGYLKGAQYFHLTSNSITQLNNRSMISTINLTIDNTAGIVGSGSLNSIKVTGTFTINSNNTVSGPIESATDDFHSGQNHPVSFHFINGATLVGLNDISNYIPISGCNPEGIRNPLIVDTDGDGVTDDLDDYPLDPERAYNSFFPSEDSYASVVFEDLWPTKGDYDFNDLVLGVYGTEVTNADNELVDIYIKFNVRAVGASLQNGFGWQFSGITPDMINSVTGAVLQQGYVANEANGTESDQDSAVIIACENVEDVLHRAGGSMFNTIENGQVGTSDLIEIHIYFNPAIDRDLVGAEAYNVFLIKNQERDVEIHLSDRVPTDEMNLSLLGTGQDDSDVNTGRYYKTETGLPWGLLLLEPFDYPIEKSEVTEAYFHFAAWAESGGVDFQDWYSNKTTPGYRDNSKIYGDE